MNKRVYKMMFFIIVFLVPVIGYIFRNFGDKIDNNLPENIWPENLLEKMENKRDDRGTEKSSK